MTTNARLASLRRTLASVKRRTLEVRMFTRPGQTDAARRAWDHIRSIESEILSAENRLADEVNA